MTADFLHHNRHPKPKKWGQMSDFLIPAFVYIKKTEKRKIIRRNNQTNGGNTNGM